MGEINPESHIISAIGVSLVLILNLLLVSRQWIAVGVGLLGLWYIIAVFTWPNKDVPWRTTEEPNPELTKAGFFVCLPMVAVLTIINVLAAVHSRLKTVVYQTEGDMR